MSFLDACVLAGARIGQDDAADLDSAAWNVSSR